MRNRAKLQLRGEGTRDYCKYQKVAEHSTFLREGERGLRGIRISDVKTNISRDIDRKIEGYNGPANHRLFLNISSLTDVLMRKVGSEPQKSKVFSFPLSQDSQLDPEIARSSFSPTHFAELVRLRPSGGLQTSDELIRSPRDSSDS